MFNETFAPVGKYAKSHPVTACLWNEAVAGRSANDIISCFHQIVERLGSLRKITFWLDNCSAQNKNWGLFLHLVLIVNSPSNQVKEIALKFFEPGHTFMAADSFHAAVEKAMRQNPPVTFPDFTECVLKSKQKVDVLDMQATDFLQPLFNVSQYTLNKCKNRPYIDNIRRIIVRKGCMDLQYSSSIVDDSKLQSISLLSKKQLKIITADDFNMLNSLNFQTHPAGLDIIRKNSLLKVILPLIEEEQKQFWESIPVNNNN